MVEELKASLAEANANLAAIRDEIHREREAREQQISAARFAIGIAVAMAIVGGLVNFVLILKVWQQADDLKALQRDRAVSECERGNASRQAIVDAFDKFISALAAQATNPDPERVTRFREDFMQSLAPLAPRDCTADAAEGAQG